MKKIYNLANDEINLSHSISIIWNNKLKILLIAFITTLIGFSFNYNKPNLFKSSLIIKSSKNLEFIKFIPISIFFNDGKPNQLKELKINIPQQRKQIKTSSSREITILDRFVEEFVDYEELIFVLKENKNIKKTISQLSKKDQQLSLYSYARLFTISKSADNTYYTLNYTWSDIAESRDILDQTLKLVILNLERSVFKEIDDFFKIKKNLVINQDLRRIEYLLEQSSIAREVNIESNVTESNVSFNYNNTDVTYYLRGFKAIDKEISLIKERKHVNLNNIEKQINDLKKHDFNWVDYNIFLTETKNLKDSKMILAKSTLLGLIIGLFYVFISMAFKAQKVDRKKQTY